MAATCRQCKPVRTCVFADNASTVTYLCFLLNSLFSFTFLPPPSVTFEAPSYNTGQHCFLSARINCTYRTTRINGMFHLSHLPFIRNDDLQHERHVTHGSLRVMTADSGHGLTLLSFFSHLVQTIVALNQQDKLDIVTRGASGTFHMGAPFQKFNGSLDFLCNKVVQTSTRTELRTDCRGHLKGDLHRGSLASFRHPNVVAGRGSEPSPQD